MYQKFPTPLINRLEKHFVLISSVLEDWQENVLKQFEDWISAFSSPRLEICTSIYVKSVNFLHE